MSDQDVDTACASRDSFEALLARLAEISAPNTGCATVFIALGRLASTVCDWVDGDLAIELLDVEECTEVRVMTELGGGMRERLFAPVTLRAPLSELMTVLEASPSLVGALQMHRRSWKRVTLDAIAHGRRSTRPPRIADASLFVNRPDAMKAAAKARSDSAESESDVDASWDDPPGGRR